MTLGKLNLRYMVLGELRYVVLCLGPTHAMKLRNTLGILQGPNAICMQARSSFGRPCNTTVSMSEHKRCIVPWCASGVHSAKSPVLAMNDVVQPEVARLIWVFDFRGCRIG